MVEWRLGGLPAAEIAARQIDDDQGPRFGDHLFFRERESVSIAADAAWALGAVNAIAVLLWIALRRIADVILIITLVPLWVAAIVTLGALCRLQYPINFANIVALPVLLGVGVAFKFIISWHGAAGKPRSCNQRLPAP
jgi:predicted exporter